MKLQLHNFSLLPVKFGINFTGAIETFVWAGMVIYIYIYYLYAGIFDTDLTSNLDGVHRIHVLCGYQCRDQSTLPLCLEFFISMKCLLSILYTDDR